MTSWRRPARKGIPQKAALGLTLALVSGPVVALDDLDFDTPGMTEDLRSQIKAYSALAAAEGEDRVSGQDILAAALSDYGILTETLYDAGYYGGVISITLDGREASGIPLLDTPDRVGTVRVEVRQGPRFTFGRAEIAPLAPDTVLPGGFASGEIAAASVVGDAADAGIEGWRQAGHAKAGIAQETVTADHRDSTLDVAMGVAPGPRLTFGALKNVNDSNVRSAAAAASRAFPPERSLTPTRSTMRCAA